MTRDADYAKRLDAAAKVLGGKTLHLIDCILRKHDSAVIEASLEAIHAAVLAEREACIADCNAEARDDGTAQRIIAAIHARGQT